MRDPLYLTPCKPGQVSGAATSLQHLKVIDIQLGFGRCSLSNKNLNRSRVVRTRWIWAQEYRSSLIHSLSRRGFVPRCQAEFNELAQRSTKSSREAVQVSGSLRGSTDGATNIDVNGNAAAASPCSSSQNQRNYAFNHLNTIGVLGGLAPVATVEFVRKIVEATNADDENDHVPLLMCSDPNMRKIISAGLVVAGTNGSVSEVQQPSVEPLLKKRRFLEQAGAKCIVMPCHVSHLWYDQLAEGCSIPFLHMADCVVEELKAANLRPLEAGSRPKIGVLGTQATLAAEFYQEKLRSQGFDVALPDKATVEHAVIPGIAALQRGDMEGARNLMRIAVQTLLVKAANIVLLACHNTPTVFSADDPVLRKCIDPTDALARAAVRWSQTRGMKGIIT